MLAILAGIYWEENLIDLWNKLMMYTVDFLNVVDDKVVDAIAAIPVPESLLTYSTAGLPQGVLYFFTLISLTWGLKMLVSAFISKSLIKLVI